MHYAPYAPFQLLCGDATRFRLLRMDLKATFQKASEEVKQLATRPSNEQLLALYSLFKQATEGDVEGKRPSMLDLKGRAKFDAWAARKGLSTHQAMSEYISLVNKLREG